MSENMAKELNKLLREILIDEQRYFTEHVKQANLTSQQARTIGYIDKHPGAIQRDVADAFKRRGASISNMLKNLERDGYIERKRSPTNDRTKVLYITEKGKQVITEVDDIFKTIEKKLVENMDDLEVSKLLTLLKKIKFTD